MQWKGNVTKQEGANLRRNVTASIIDHNVDFAVFEGYICGHRRSASVGTRWRASSFIIRYRETFLVAEERYIRHHEQATSGLIKSRSSS